MASEEVIRSVAKHLKYYVDIKRREDGFDLSGPELPRMDHPHLKSGPVMNYQRNYDRSLKHYFSTNFDSKRPMSVERGARSRIIITQLKVPKTDKRKPDRTESAKQSRFVGSKEVSTHSDKSGSSPSSGSQKSSSSRDSSKSKDTSYSIKNYVVTVHSKRRMDSLDQKEKRKLRNRSVSASSSRSSSNEKSNSSVKSKSSEESEASRHSRSGERSRPPKKLNSGSDSRKSSSKYSDSSRSSSESSRVRYKSSSRPKDNSVTRYSSRDGYGSRQSSTNNLSLRQRSKDDSNSKRIKDNPHEESKQKAGEEQKTSTKKEKSDIRKHLKPIENVEQKEVSKTNDNNNTISSNDCKLEKSSKGPKSSKLHKDTIEQKSVSLEGSTLKKKKHAESSKANERKISHTRESVPRKVSPEKEKLRVRGKPESSEKTRTVSSSNQNINTRTRPNSVPAKTSVTRNDSRPRINSAKQSDVRRKDLYSRQGNSLEDKRRFGQEKKLQREESYEMRDGKKRRDGSGPKNGFDQKENRDYSTNQTSKQDELARRQDIQRSLKLYMKQYHYASPLLIDVSSLFKLTRFNPKRETALEAFRRQQLTRAKKPATGGYPVLRSRPPSYVSADEKKRLMNTASKLVAVVESIPVHDPHMKEDRNTERRKKHAERQAGGYPKPFESDPVYDNDSFVSLSNDDGSTHPDELQPRPPSSSRPTDHVSSSRLSSARLSTGRTVNTIDESRDRRYQEEVEKLKKKFMSEMREMKDKQLAAEIALEELYYLCRQGQKQRVSQEDVHPRDKNNPNKNNKQIDEQMSPKTKKADSDKRRHLLEKERILEQEQMWKKKLIELRKKHRLEMKEFDEMMKRTLEDLESSRIDDNKELENIRQEISNVAPKSVQSEDEEISYTVDVFTGALPHDSSRKTNTANVHIVIVGENGSSMPMPLEHSKLHKMKFRENQLDSFEIRCPYLGRINRIDIGHDSVDADFRWHVENVVIREEARDKVEYIIPCRKILTAGRLSRRSNTESEVPLVSKATTNSKTIEKSDTRKPVPQVSGGADDDETNALVKKSSPALKKRRRINSETSSSSSSSSSSKSTNQSPEPRPIPRNRSNLSDTSDHTNDKTPVSPTNEVSASNVQQLLFKPESDDKRNERSGSISSGATSSSSSNSSKRASPRMSPNRKQKDDFFDDSPHAIIYSAIVTDSLVSPHEVIRNDVDSEANKAQDGDMKLNLSRRSSTDEIVKEEQAGENFREKLHDKPDGDSSSVSSSEEESGHVVFVDNGNVIDPVSFSNRDTACESLKTRSPLFDNTISNVQESNRIAIDENQSGPPTFLADQHSESDKVHKSNPTTKPISEDVSILPESGVIDTTEHDGNQSGRSSSLSSTQSTATSCSLPSNASFNRRQQFFAALPPLDLNNNGGRNLDEADRYGKIATDAGEQNNTVEYAVESQPRDNNSFPQDDNVDSAQNEIANTKSDVDVRVHEEMNHSQTEADVHLQAEVRIAQIEKVVVGQSGSSLKVPSAMYGDITSDTDTGRSTPYMAPESVPNYPLYKQYTGELEKIDSYEMTNEDDKQTLSMHDATRTGNLSELKELVTNCGSQLILQESDEDGMNLLHVAAVSDQTDIVKWLATIFSDLDQLSQDGHSALQLAVMNGNLTCAMALFDMGARIDLKSADGQTALHLAAQFNQLGLVQWLISVGSNPLDTDNEGRRAIDVAEEFECTAIVQALVGHYPEGQQRKRGRLNAPN